MAKVIQNATVNGVDVETVGNLAKQLSEDKAQAEKYASFTRRARVRWISGVHSEAYIRSSVPTVQYDEPEWLGGTDKAIAASEALLGAIGGCISVGFAANAAVQNVEVRELRVEVEGEINLPAFLGLQEGNPGYSNIRIAIYCDTDADEKTLSGLIDKAVNLSPVVNTVRNPVDVQYKVWVAG